MLGRFLQRWQLQMIHWNRVRVVAAMRAVKVVEEGQSVVV